MFAAPWTPTTPRLGFQFLEEQPIGTVLTTLQATDADSSIEEYRLEPNDYFELNNRTGTSLSPTPPSAAPSVLSFRSNAGVIRTKARIDFESIKKINLNASVTDTGIPQLSAYAEIIVDVINTNDNEPAFDTNEYNMMVLENSLKGTVIGKVEAKDQDDGKCLIRNGPKSPGFN